MQRVKVRLKINTARYLGTIEYPSRYFRFSDFLDGEQDFLKILRPESTDLISTESVLLVNKKSIVYIHSVEQEYRKQSFSPNGEFFHATIRLKDGERIKGLIFCSYEESEYPMEGILRQSGYFLKVRNPVITGTSEQYNFLAVGKSEILTVELDPKAHVLDGSLQAASARIAGGSQP